MIVGCGLRVAGGAGLFVAKSASGGGKNTTEENIHFSTLDLPHSWVDMDVCMCVYQGSGDQGVARSSGPEDSLLRAARTRLELRLRPTDRRECSPH